MGVGKTPQVPGRVPTSIPCLVLTLGVILAAGGGLVRAGTTGCRLFGVVGGLPPLPGRSGPVTWGLYRGNGSPLPAGLWTRDR
jgi:hypothetical protein